MSASCRSGDRHRYNGRPYSSFSTPYGFEIRSTSATSGQTRLERVADGADADDRPVLDRRSPQPVGVVSTERGREAGVGSEDVDRAGLAVRTGEDRHVGAVGFGDRPVDRRHLVDQLRPADRLAQLAGGVQRRHRRWRQEGKGDEQADSDPCCGDSDHDPARSICELLEPERSGRQQHRVHRSDVVRLPPGEQEEGEQHGERDADRSPALELRPANQRPESDRGRNRKDDRKQTDLFEYERNGSAAATGERVRHLELRKAVRQLPGEVGRCQDHSDPDSDPRPPIGQQTPSWGGDQPDQNGNGKQPDQVFVEQADADRRTEGEPPPRVGVVEQADEDPRRQRPRQVVETRGAQEMPDGERHP